MAVTNSLLVDVALAFSGLYVLKRLFFPKAAPHPPLPPGPKGKPVIGNLLDVPQPGQQEWLFWGKHKDLYGPISSLSIFGQTIVLINDRKTAFDMLDKRSAVFSGRPVLPFAGQMCGYENALAMLPYGDRFRTLRRYLHQYVGTSSAMVKHYPLQELETRRFLRRLVDCPERLAEQIRSATGSIILKMSHGYTVEHESPDPLVKLADDALAEFSKAAEAGAWLVDVLPFLKELPDWFPGTNFKQVGKRWKRNLDTIVDKPHAFVKQQMASGSYFPSFTSAFLENGLKDADEDFTLKWAAFAIYGGGADTTVSSLYTFFLAMVLYPDVQKAAQAELDRVVGSDRLPTFADREKLPYVDAIVKEVLRWNPVAPLGIPHASTEDTVYNGYFIPKGTIIIPNIWQYAHDPETYHDPMTFDPTRFLGEQPAFDSHELSFGFGRRICPGRELADASIFIAIAMSLAVFNISKATDANGKIIEPVYEYTPGIISHPKDYECSIKPRSQHALALIKSVEEEHPFERSDAEALANLKWE